MGAWGLNAQDSIDLPNFTNPNGSLVLERGRFGFHVVDALRQRGHGVRESDLTGGRQAIQMM